MASTQSVLMQKLHFAAMIAFYMVTALVMVFINKAVLISTPSLPLLFVCIQLAIAVVLLHAAALFTDAVELPKLDGEKLRRLAPLIAVTAIGLVFNTLCLRDVDASFFTIARGLVLPLTILVSSTVSNHTPHRDILLSALIVTAGFVLGVLHLGPGFTWTPGAPPLALIYGLLASLAIAVHASLIRCALPLVGGSAVQLAYATNAGALALLLPLAALAGEPQRLLALAESGAWNWQVFATGTVITGVCGFLLCVAALSSVKATGAVAHMFASAARSVLQTILGVWLFNDLLTFNRVLSIFTITVGTLCYTWVKSVERLPGAQSTPRLLGFAVGGLEKIDEEDESEDADDDEDQPGGYWMEKRTAARRDLEEWY